MLLAFKNLISFDSAGLILMYFMIFNTSCYFLFQFQKLGIVRIYVLSY